MQPLISVIVPVYNVEAFVERSLRSIIGQTYANLEIIVVNDGSTDRSFEICKKIAKEDRRIFLLEQENQGLSAARNTGIARSKGEYIMFVDSDDWLSPNMIEFLFTEIKKYDVKLAMCGFQKVKDEANVKLPKIDKTEVISSGNAIERMLLGEWWSACMKLYSSEIFRKVRFPEGRTFEDYAVMVKILEQCEKVTYNSAPLYFYLTREGSITTKPLNPRNFDEILNSVEVLDYVKKNHPQYYRQAERNLGASLIKLILKIYQDKSGKFDEKLGWLLPILNEHKKTLLKNPYLPSKQKLIVRMLTALDEGGRRKFSNAYKWYLKNLKS